MQVVLAEAKLLDGESVRVPVVVKETIEALRKRQGTVMLVKKKIGILCFFFFFVFLWCFLLPN